MTTKELSFTLIKNTFDAALRIRLQKHPVLKPVFFTYYLTLRCNFDCVYCNYAKHGSNKEICSELAIPGVIKLLKIIRKDTPNIYFTGGEPLLRQDIVDICKACYELGFKSISINSNMNLMHQRMEVLDYLTNLVASFDTVDDVKNAEIIQMPVSTAARVRENIIACAKLQRQKDFQMNINCVVMPDTINNAREVMEFCFEHNIRFVLVPAELKGGWVNPELKNNKEYQSLIDDVVKAKKRGRPVMGNYGYFKIIRDFKPFDCYPTLVPHIYPNGDLFYPCEPMRKIAGNLLKAGSYSKLLKIGINKFGHLPMCKDRCHKACYVIPYCFFKNPFLLFSEFKNFYKK